MPKKIKVPGTSVVFDELLAVHVGSVGQGKPFLYLTPDARDAIIAANTFLAVMQDGMEKQETLIRMQRVIHYLSNMLYGFEEA